MVIIDTKISSYMKRSNGAELRLYDVLRFTYNEILNDELTQKLINRQNVLTGDGEIYGKPIG